MKIAILHEMLIKLGGAEKVVENWYKIYPEADIFTLIYDKEKVGKIFPKNKINKQVFNLTTQSVYKYTKKQRFCLPFMSKAIEQLDFSEYDVVLCSSSGFAHGAITKPETKFIVYCHSPARYMWDWTNEYKKDIGADSGIKLYILNKLFLKLRQWDYIASKRADITLANSTNTAGRITKYYRKDSEILYPPVETSRFGKKITSPQPYTSEERGQEQKNVASFSLEGKIFNIGGKILKLNNYYIIISALTEFKKIEIAIEGFNKLNNKKLVIIGQGNYKSELEKISEDNIIFTGAKYGDELVSLVQNSNGLIFPGEEDFGIVPIEVMSAGKPIFAYKGGGLLETVLEGITGEFFNDKNGKDFIKNFKLFDQNNINGKYLNDNCKKQADKFSENKFERRIKEIVENG